MFHEAGKRSSVLRVCTAPGDSHTPCGIKLPACSCQLTPSAACRPLPASCRRSCVAIVASSALRAMIKPGLLAVAAPCLVGIAFRGLGAATGQPMLGAKAVAGFLMFTTVAGAPS